jgi:hypothetical protein
MRLILLLLLAIVSVPAVELEERERLRDQFTDALSALSEVQQRLVEVAAGGGVQLPPGVPATLAARRTLAEGWLKRIADPVAEFPPEEADTFRDGLEGLRGRMDGVIGLVEQSTSAADRWPHSLETAEFVRYRTFLRQRIDQGLQEIASGAEHPVDEEQTWRRQRRHELILQLMESAQQSAERWSLVPKDAPVLREYQDHRTALRAAAESSLQQANPANDRDLDRDEAVLWLLDELVSQVQMREERRNQREIPAQAPLLVAFHLTLSGEERAIRAQIAHRRGDMTDETAWYRQEETLRREREQRSRLSSLAWEVLEIDLSISERRQQITEQMTDAPASVRDASVPRLRALEQERDAIVIRLTKALDAGARVDVLKDKSALRLLQREHEMLAEDLAQLREREEQETEWRARAGEPGVREALAKLDAAWKAMADARGRQSESEQAAIRAELARELAEVESESAQLAAELSRQELDRAREAVERSREHVVDVLENPQPKPEGDAKF